MLLDLRIDLEPIRTWIASNKMAIARAVLLLTIVIGLVAANYRGRSYNVEQTYKLDLLQTLCSPINKQLRDDPSLIPNVAGFVLWLQYLFFGMMCVKIAERGHRAWIGILACWVAGTAFRWMMVAQLSRTAIVDYSEHLPFPLEKYLDDTVFSSHSYLACLYHNTLIEDTERHRDYPKRAVFVINLVLVCVLFSILQVTTLQALFLGIAVANMTDNICTWCVDAWNRFRKCVSRRRTHTWMNKMDAEARKQTSHEGKVTNGPVPESHTDHRGRNVAAAKEVVRSVKGNQVTGPAVFEIAPFEQILANGYNSDPDSTITEEEAKILQSLKPTNIRPPHYDRTERKAHLPNEDSSGIAATNFKEALIAAVQSGPSTVKPMEEVSIEDVELDPVTKERIKRMEQEKDRSAVVPLITAEPSPEEEEDEEAEEEDHSQGSDSN